MQENAREEDVQGRVLMEGLGEDATVRGDGARTEEERHEGGDTAVNEGRRNARSTGKDTRLGEVLREVQT